MVVIRVEYWLVTATTKDANPDGSRDYVEKPFHLLTPRV
jgi:hypothetical protein